MSDAEVINILIKPGDYLPDAVELAKFEAIRRRLPDEYFVVAQQHARAFDETLARRASTPLSTSDRAFNFFIPFDLFSIFTALAHSGSGFKRKSRETVLWSLYGILFYIVVVGLLFAFGYAQRAEPP